MFRNHLKTAWRNLTNHKAHSFINLSGLSVGIACSLLILLWIRDERSVDGYHKNGDRLYRVYGREYYINNVDGNYDTPGLMAQELKRSMPEVEDAIMLQEENKISTLQANNKILKVEGTAAGAGLFTMFSYPLLQGTPATALASTVSIAISKKTAAQFFGNAQNAMGKTILFDNRRSFMVTAVFDDLPHNTSRTFDYAISWDAWLQDHPWALRWDNSGPVTFVLLRKDANPELVDKKLTHFLDGYEKKPKAGYHSELGLQKFSEAYLYNNFKNGYATGGRIEYVHLFGIVAAFILLIACINFMNLSTARSIKRAREVGVRKVAGAMRGKLIKQFIGESLLLTTIAVCIALALVIMALPAFNFITKKQITFPFNSTDFWVQVLAITLVTGIISGSYPALFLSSFNPIKVLKGTVRIGSGIIWFRKGLVVFQFVLAIVLITGTIVVSKQVRFIQSKNLGYDRENLIYIPLEGNLPAKYETFKAEALKLPGIQSCSFINDNPANLDNQTNSVNWDGRDPNTLISVEQPMVGYGFVRTMKMQLVAGRDFSSDFPTDAEAFILNETAAKKIGYTNPVGRSITMQNIKGPIIGVVKDFHFRSLHEAIQPLIFRLRTKPDGGNILIRTQPGTTKEVLAGVERLYRQLNPQFPFTFSFSDEAYQKLYMNEQVISKLSDAFSFLAIFISCLGLLGLVMFSAEQRIKEIGIRKVLGASVMGIVQLMSADLLKLVIIAIVISTPVAWWAMNQWLDNYAYKTPVTWWMFALAGSIAVLIAAFTISFQSIKAALANPAVSLKTE